MSARGVRHEIRLLAVAGPPVVRLSELPAACEAAVAGGVTAVQVRVKSATARELLELTEVLMRRLSVPVWVNDRADVALAAGARGVHLGQDDVSPRAVRAFAGDVLRVGLSVGTEAQAGVAIESGADYWSIGSVYRTDTKPDAGEPIGVEGFRRLAGSAPADTPVIGIGGITAANVAAVMQAGAAGVAVSAALFGGSDVAAAARALRDAIDGARRV